MSDIEPLRRLARKMGRNHAFPRRLPKHLGGAKFLASTEGGLKFLRRRVEEIDPELTSFAQEFVRVGDCVWDIGANVGLFTFAAAGLTGSSGRVLAVDADPWLAANLIKASRFADLRAPVDVLCAAVSSNNGLAVFHVSNLSRAVNHLSSGGASRTDGTRYVQPVTTVTLDSLLSISPQPNVLKIDVERVELEVLRGANKLLDEIRPIILIEVGSELAEDVTHIFDSKRYDLLDWRARKPVKLAAYSTVAVPREL